MTLDDLPTPCLLIDCGKLTGNLGRMRERVAAARTMLRPHVKTAKSWEVLRRALDPAHGAVTVSTLLEADYVAAHGVRDVLYAVGITPDKLGHVARLQQAGVRMTVVLDSVEGARQLAARGEALGARFTAAIEVDCDGHRSGIRPDDPLLLAVAQILHGSHSTALAGVMTHAGEAYFCQGAVALEAAVAERRAALAAAQALREASLPCSMVSVGSTPTALFARDSDGVTEVRAGVYMFQDLVMAGIGVCHIEEIALSVLCSVIGWRRDRGWVVTDAGWMALSRDRGTARQDIDQQYGLVCDLDGHVIPGVLVDSTSQEHGILAHRQGRALPPEDYPLGRRLRVLPNHACATAAQHDRYEVVGGARNVIGTWPRIRGW